MPVAVDYADLATTRGVLDLVVVTLLLALAGLLGARKGATPAGRAAALFLALLALARLAARAGPLAGLPPDVAGRSAEWLRIGALLAAALVLAHAGGRPGLRRPSTWAALGAAALVGAGALLWAFERGALRAEDLGRATLLRHLTLGWGANLALLLAGAVAARETRHRPVAERLAAGGALAGVLAGSLATAGSTATQVVLEVAGVDATFSAFRAALAGVPGDPLGLTRLVVDAAQLAALGLAAALALRGSRAAAALVGIGAVAWLAAVFVPPEFTASPELLHGVAMAHAAGVRGAFRGPPWSRAAAAPFGALVFLAVFLNVTHTAFAITREPLSVALGTVLGVAAGAAAVGLVVPPARRWWDAVRSAPEGGPGPAAAGAGAGADPGAGAGPGSGGPIAAGAVVLGRYRVLEPLGEGAFGSTWLADDAVVGRRVVLKAVRRGDDADGALLREAQALAALHHPRVVTLFDVGAAGGRAFIVMEHAPGGSLAARLQRGALPLAEWRRLAGDVLEALEAIHRAGLVHRDVKPSNVLLAADGGAKLADFGIAALPGAEATMAGLRDGATLGTVRFMSPEQARGRATPRSDLFSAGATLYEALTGQPYLAPLPGETAAELQLRAAFARPFPRGAPVPSELRGWFARALDPAPERRFASAAEMRRALERAAARRRVRGSSASAGPSS